VSEFDRGHGPLSHQGTMVIIVFTGDTKIKGVCAFRAVSIHTLDALSHVVVEYERHVLNVNASPGHVGSNKNVFAAALKHCQRKLSLLLALAAVQRDRVVLRTQAEMQNDFNKPKMQQKT